MERAAELQDYPRPERWSWTNFLDLLEKSAPTDIFPLIRSSSNHQRQKEGY